SLEAMVRSVPAPSGAPRAPLRVRALFAGFIALVIAGVSFGVMGAIREPSMDVVVGDKHVGFYRNGGPLHWGCSEGHDHWSMPYWSGALGLLVLAAALWRAWYVRWGARAR